MPAFVRLFSFGLMMVSALLERIGLYKAPFLRDGGDAMVWNMARQTGDIGADGEGWSADPYDPDFKKGFPRDLFR